jgi:hypothetical protein
MYSVYLLSFRNEGPKKRRWWWRWCYVVVVMMVYSDLKKRAYEGCNFGLPLYPTWIWHMSVE